MFYLIEKQEQLNKLKPLEDCFVRFIPQSNNFHPALSSLSLIYIRGLNEHKGYILCLDHNESFSLNKQQVFDWLNTNTNKLWVLDKKQSMYWYPNENKLYDINFIKQPDLTSTINIPAVTYYYSTHTKYPTINKIIPISKHYEESEKIFDVILPIIQSYRADNAIYAFNNGPLTRVFYEIESQGIKVDKQCFINCYGEDLKYPEFNLAKGKIYSQYNLYTLTSRPSNTYNSINFAALNKNNGERLCYRPSNDKFIEFDIQGYHPRILGDMVDFNFGDRNTYEVLGELLSVTQQEAKELTFKQLYGGVWDEYRDQPFFRDIVTLTDGIWDEYQYGGQYATNNRVFTRDEEMTQSKLLNYIIQSHETSNNVMILDNILNYLKDKKTKLVLYVYDSMLIDYASSDGDQVLLDIKNIIPYPVNIKQGNTYHDLTKI